MRAAPPVDGALTELYERYAASVFRFCRHRLRSREEAEDALQSTFLNAFRGLERGVIPANEEAWLITIARNVCLTHSDTIRRRVAEVPRDPHTLEEVVTAAAPPSDGVEGLKEALAALTEQQRRAIVLREWQGLSYSEIAETLALSQAAVETLIFRARRSLARTMRRPFGIGSLLPWFRSLAGSGAGRIAVGAAAVAATAGGAVAIAPQHRVHAPTAFVSRSAAPPRPAEHAMVSVSRPVSRVLPQHRLAPDPSAPAPRLTAPQPAPVATAPAAPTPVVAAPTAPQSAPPSQSPQVTAPAPTPATAAAPPDTESEASVPVAPATPVQTAAGNAGGAVANVVDTATGAVGQIAGTLGQTVNTTVAAATGSDPNANPPVQGVVGTVTTLLDPLGHH